MVKFQLINYNPYTLAQKEIIRRGISQPGLYANITLNALNAGVPDYEAPERLLATIGGRRKSSRKNRRSSRKRISG